MFYRPTRRIADLLQRYITMGTNRKKPSLSDVSGMRKTQIPLQQNILKPIGYVMHQQV